MSDVHVEVGTYVTDSLDAAERAAYEEHLAGCDMCRQEVAEFDETLAVLAGLAAATPPAQLRNAVLAEIRQVRPLPPLTDDLGPDSSADPSADADIDPDPYSQNADSLGGTGATSRAVDAGGADAPPTPITALRPEGLRRRRGGDLPDWDRPVDELARRRQWRRTRILTAAVAAMLVVALALGGWVYSLVQQRQAFVAQEQLAAVKAQRERSLLSAPDARVVSKTEAGAVYSFVFSKQRNEALFLGTNLGDPGAGKTYQLWTLTDPKAAPAPNALVGGFGRTQAWLDGDVDTVAAFAVSVEPAAGASTPTDIRAVVPA